MFLCPNRELQPSWDWAGCVCRGQAQIPLRELSLSFLGWKSGLTARVLPEFPWKPLFLQHQGTVLPAAFWELQPHEKGRE